MGKAACDPGSAPAKDKSQCLKKNRGGTSERGQLERSTQSTVRPAPPDPLVRAFKTWGILCGSGCRRVPAPTLLLPAPFRVPEAWFGAGAGLSRRGCLTALTGLQIPARLWSRYVVQSARVAPRFPGSGGVSSTSTRPGTSFVA